MATAFVEAGVEMGFENRDGNGANQTGFMIPQGTIRRGSRCSTAKAFLRPIRHRNNLHIAMHAQVTKILIDPESKIAYGVRFKRDSKEFIYIPIFFIIFTYCTTVRVEVFMVL